MILVTDKCIADPDLHSEIELRYHFHLLTRSSLFSEILNLHEPFPGIIDMALLNVPDAFDRVLGVIPRPGVETDCRQRYIGRYSTH